MRTNKNAFAKWSNGKQKKTALKSILLYMKLGTIFSKMQAIQLSIEFRNS